MRKILFFSHSQTLAGAEISMLDIMECLDRTRFAPVLLAPGDGPLRAKALGLGAKTRDACVPPQLLGWKRGSWARAETMLAVARSVRRLAAIIRSEKPAVLYTHSQKAHVLGGLAGRLAGIPVIWHTREMLGRPVLRRLMSALAFFVPSKIICVSRSVAGQFTAAGKAGRPKVIPNGIDAASVRRAAASRQDVRKKFGIPPCSPVVGMVSRIAPGKGQIIFLRAAAEISRRYPRTFFLIVGGALFDEGAYLRDLRSESEKQGLGRQVRFVGHLENPLPLIREMDVLVHCPVAPEGFGRSVAEAMALGIPVVSVRGGGIPELIEDGVNGLLVEPGDDKGLEKAVGRLLSDREMAGRLAQAARKKIETCFTKEAAIAAIEQILLEV